VERKRMGRALGPGPMEPVDWSRRFRGRAAGANDSEESRMTVPSGDEAGVRSGKFFHFFVPGPVPPALAAAGAAGAAERVATREVVGTRYEVGNGETALVLAGSGRVKGEVWRCAVEVLKELDQDERVVGRLWRRVGVQVGEYPCWTYVAGPKMAPMLARGRQPE